MKLFGPLALACLSAGSAFADDTLLKRPDVAKALRWLETSHDKTVAAQITIAEIPAPTFHEAERAKYLEKEFRRLGLADVSIDKQGNVLGWRKGSTEDTFVIAAHLDISFAIGVDTKVRKEGDRLLAPGIGDDSRGLASLLAIVEAMDAAKISTRHTLLFVANVGEEGLGDLNGARYLFNESTFRAKLRAFISIDGADPSRIVTGGTGVKRYRVTLKGPGGHSYGNFGRPSPIHAAARAIDRIADLEVPLKPKTTFNVGRIEGGTAVNAIAEECAFEVDLRSVDPGNLDRIEAKLFEAVRLGVEAENKARAASKATLSFDMKLVSNRPAGETAHSSPIVQAAMWAAGANGFRPELDFSSTDSNIPISKGIPAVTMGGGGTSGNAHSLAEWYSPVQAWKGPQTVLLTFLDFDSRRP